MWPFKKKENNKTEKKEDKKYNEFKWRVYFKLRSFEGLWSTRGSYELEKPITQKEFDSNTNKYKSLVRKDILSKKIKLYSNDDSATYLKNFKFKDVLYFVVRNVTVDES